jgi:hypothetical protein
MSIMRSFRRAEDQSYDPFAGSGESLPEGWTCTARRRPSGIAAVVEQDGWGFDLLIPHSAIEAEPGDADARIRRHALDTIARLERPGGREDTDRAVQLLASQVPTAVGINRR